MANNNSNINNNIIDIEGNDIIALAEKLKKIDELIQWHTMQTK